MNIQNDLRINKFTLRNDAPSHLKPFMVLSSSTPCNCVLLYTSSEQKKMTLIMILLLELYLLS